MLCQIHKRHVYPAVCEGYGKEEEEEEGRGVGGGGGEGGLGGGSRQTRIPGDVGRTR